MDPTSDFGANDWLIDEMRAQYEKDPGSVDSTWAAFFERENGAVGEAAPAPTPAAKHSPAPTPELPTTAHTTDTAKAPAAQPVPDTASDEPPAARPAKVEGPADPGSSGAVPVGTAPEPRRNTQPTTATPEARKAEKPRPSAAPKPAKAAPASRKDTDEGGPTRTQMRGTPMRTARNMEASLAVPTATSVRNIPMKLVIDQRMLINDHLARTTGGKVSFTHLIGYAMVRALVMVPDMNRSYEEVDGRPFLVEPDHVNLGLAIDLKKPDGTRQLVVPNIKGCETLSFIQFWRAYDDMVARARTNALTVDDYQGTTATLTNPGGIGTSHSVPRLMAGQGLILGVGSIDYPPELMGASNTRMNELGVSKITTLTSTYDHRVIQGATSGQFLKVMNELLLGEHDFYKDVFTSLRIPYAPLPWAEDDSAHRPYEVSKGARIIGLINSFRQFGHLIADTDPLEYRMRSHPDLELAGHGLSLWDLEREYPVGNFGGHQRETMKVRDIIMQLRQTYCGRVGVEYMHIQDPEQRRWLQELLERPGERWPREEHLRMLDRLNEAEVFETFLQTKFVGQKRFSLEGGESAIVALDEICDAAANAGLTEVIIGMPHRGRLNVLANIVGKSYGQIFREFEGNVDPHLTMGTGDVKYHLGAEGEFTALTGRTIKTSVAANPSHLEAVNPVVEGIARAKLDALGDPGDYPILPVLLHGDASFAGQGVVYETLQLSQLRGYKTGGTIHVIVNNQVGFTTAPSESRSSVYCTDVAKVVQAPIFHVNGDDAEAVARISQLAFKYRQKFNKDVVIDIVCYRRRGHNEGDDPSFTQPRMYDLIEQKRSVRKVYTDALIGRGDITDEDAAAVLEKFRERLEGVFKEVRDTAEDGVDDGYTRVPFYPMKLGKDQGTAVTREAMNKVADALLTVPEGFRVHNKVLPQMERRAESIRTGPIDWAAAEILAFGTVLLEGINVRVAGQDSRRGTFSTRFAALVDRQTGEEYVPLKHLDATQGAFHIYDSLLSEYASMGFEYGYSVASPQSLVCWEAQFGDFANGAQTIADEFISSGTAKWTQKSGVVLLLPHGYEGQGPDHSSSRLERWLQLCSEGALAVAQPSTAASYFHLLRTHTYVNFHRPLVILTPKSMLRSKAAASPIEEFTDGRWRPAIDDPTIEDPSKVRSVLLCSGKIRWELAEARTERGLDGQVAIIALERLYPLPVKELSEALNRYRHVTDVRWVQDEPVNQGAWSYVNERLADALVAPLPDYELNLRVVARPEGAAPSVGMLSVHKEQADDLHERAFEE